MVYPPLTAKEKAKLKEDKQRLQHIRAISAKIIHAYKIRLMCMRNRHQLLVGIEHNFNNISDPGFYKTTKINLDRERKLLEIIKREETDMGSNLSYLIKTFKSYRGMSGRYIEIVKDRRFQLYGHAPGAGYNWLKNLDVNWNKVYYFCDCMIDFLRQMEKDLAKIELRIEKEELFLKLENRNPQYFKSFISAWEDEVKANRKLVKHFKNVLIDMSNIQNTFRGLGSHGLELMDDVMMGEEGNPFAIPVATMLIFMGLVEGLFSLFKREVTEDKSDKNLLKTVESMGKKRPFFKRIFA